MLWHFQCKSWASFNQLPGSEGTCEWVKSCSLTWAGPWQQHAPHAPRGVGQLWGITDLGATQTCGCNTYNELSCKDPLGSFSFLNYWNFLFSIGFYIYWLRVPQPQHLGLGNNPCCSGRLRVYSSTPAFTRPMPVALSPPVAVTEGTPPHRQTLCRRSRPRWEALT